jgi:hypothetical protein
MTKTVKPRPEVKLFATDTQGQYIPQNFANLIHRGCVKGVSEHDWTILEAGPNHEWYWDTWNTVLDNAKIHDPTGTVYFLYQDGDLWLIPKGMTYSEDEGTWK